MTATGPAIAEVESAVAKAMAVGGNGSWPGPSAPQNNGNGRIACRPTENHDCDLDLVPDEVLLEACHQFEQNITLDDLLGEGWRLMREAGQFLTGVEEVQAAGWLKGLLRAMSAQPGMQVTARERVSAVQAYAQKYPAPTAVEREQAPAREYSMMHGPTEIRERGEVTPDFPRFADV